MKTKAALVRVPLNVLHFLRLVGQQTLIGCFSDIVSRVREGPKKKKTKQKKGTCNARLCHPTSIQHQQKTRLIPPIIEGIVYR